MINEFEKLCINRKSIRKFSDKLIEDNKIIQILNSVNSAPSAGNLQAYEVIVVKSKDVIVKLYEAALHQNFIAQAPVVLVFVAKTQESSEQYGKRGEQLYSIQDATIACTYAMLACEALDISSTWVGAFEDKKIKEILDCKKGEIPIALLPIGYTLSNKISFIHRKDLDEMSREL
ncbi:nitroreductase [Clostridium pascui]|uniref:nitroreductase family protein n=1 Tax=Clostridium pascui TaxID=46609 RepID=UPI00195B981B|nr:nitroreductase family protein [Clostridium pascui]MBM7868751.1 nitroreductase [Clostridium pascui]